MKRQTSAPLISSQSTSSRPCNHGYGLSSVILPAASSPPKLRAQTEPGHGEQHSQAQRKEERAPPCLCQCPCRSAPKVSPPVQLRLSQRRSKAWLSGFRPWTWREGLPPDEERFPETWKRRKRNLSPGEGPGPALRDAPRQGQAGMVLQKQ